MARDVPPAFFAYSRQDSDFALRLAKDLKAAGANVWIDQLDIVPGEHWDRAVEDALATCSRMLVILSPASVNSTNVMDEVSFALEENKTVIPIICIDCTIPFRLRRLQHLDFRSDYARGFAQLLGTLAPPPTTGGPPEEREPAAGQAHPTAEEARQQTERAGVDTSHQGLARKAKDTAEVGEVVGKGIRLPVWILGAIIAVAMGFGVYIFWPNGSPAKEMPTHSRLAKQLAGDWFEAYRREDVGRLVGLSSLPFYVVGADNVLTTMTSTQQVKSWYERGIRISHNARWAVEVQATRTIAEWKREKGFKATDRTLLSAMAIEDDDFAISSKGTWPGGAFLYTRMIEGDMKLAGVFQGF